MSRCEMVIVLNDIQIFKSANAMHSDLIHTSKPLKTTIIAAFKVYKKSKLIMMQSETLQSYSRHCVDYSAQVKVFSQIKKVDTSVSLWNKDVCG